MLVPGDASALEQLFLNAVEAVRDHGEVRVEVERVEEQVIVRVIDTGVGLTPNVARRAFELFFTTREGGTGLGLSIAGRLARAHDGSVALDGAPGRGATATVTLPLWTEGV
jgi:signal transduction histidine kinase